MEDFKISNERTEYVIRHEIKSFSNLVTKRKEWLENPTNKMKGTYKAVLQDTSEMEAKLKDLETELEKVQSKVNV